MTERWGIARNDPAEKILADLISELREQSHIWLEGGMDSADDAVFQVVAQQVTALIDRAALRLQVDKYTREED